MTFFYNNVSKGRGPRANYKSRAFSGKEKGLGVGRRAFVFEPGPNSSLDKCTLPLWIRYKLLTVCIFAIKKIKTTPLLPPVDAFFVRTIQLEQK